MPSPFPGMDQYLEAPEIFPDFHDRLIGELSSALNRNLHPPYFSTIASKVFIERFDRFIGPDIGILHAGGIEPQVEDGGVGKVVISEVDVQPVVIHVPDDEIRELSLEIRTTDDQRLVTSIEVLRLANKTSGEHGRGL